MYYVLHNISYLMHICNLEDISLRIKTYGCYTKLPSSHLTARTVISIDLLRSSTSMTWALVNGATKVIPTADAAEAVSIANRMGGCILGGERGGIKLPGFDLGNSPFEYNRETVNGKSVIVSTTNGTGALCGAEGAANVLLGCMLNCTAVARRAVELGNDIIIMCAGTDHDISADDLYAAGAIAETIIRLADGDVSACDMTLVACMVYKSWKNDLRELSLTYHCSRLLRLGFEKDVEFCLRRDVTDIVPEYINGVLEAGAPM